MPTQFRLKHTLGKEKWSKERVLQNTNEAGVFSLKEKKKENKLFQNKFRSPIITYRPCNSNTLTLCLWMRKTKSPEPKLLQWCETNLLVFGKQNKQEHQMQKYVKYQQKHLQV